jgi:membrane fusion protein (multidrug efflux system)
MNRFIDTRSVLGAVSRGAVFRRAVLPLLAVFSLSPLPACKRDDAKPANAPVVKPVEKARVEVVRAIKHTFSGRLPITGELKPIQEVSLKSRVGGNVILLNYDEGDYVKKGALIAKIEASNQNAQLRSSSASVSVADAQLLRAKADLERLNNDYKRVEMLHEKGAGDQKSLDDIKSAVKLATVGVQSAQAQLEQARASRDLSRNAVGETRYVAPISGVISRRGVALHEYVDTMKNREIVTIVDNSAMELVASVAADLASGLVKGATVEFQVKSSAGKTLTGQVIAVNPTVDPRTRTIRLRVRIPNPDGILKGGMYATGFVTVGGERLGTGVPQLALRQEAAMGEESDDDAPEAGDKQSVLWRVRDSVVEKLVVHTGLSDGDLVEVLDGIKVGDQVVISSPAGLRSGQSVVAQESQALSQNQK